jgi:4-hydroxy-3-methylbut-2-enyl diphosphate reductase
VPKSVPAAAEARQLEYVDATCPLVSKVHRQAERYSSTDKHIVFIGHAGHPEVIGTFGQVPEGHISLVETTEDAQAFVAKDPDNLAYLTQTTLSVDDTADVINVLKQKYPNIEGPKSEDICYATSNRQTAVKILAKQSDLVIVIGARNSSNSMRLVESSEKLGTPAILVARAEDLDFNWLHQAKTIGITAGASAPEILVRELVDHLASRYEVSEEEVVSAEEDIEFKLPKSLVSCSNIAAVKYLKAKIWPSIP